MDDLERRYIDAVTVGDINVVTESLKNGVNVDARNEEHRTALMRAARSQRCRQTGQYGSYESSLPGP